MKKIRAMLFLSCFVLFVQAQVSIHLAPAEGLEQRIKKHIDTLKVVDTHEHLSNPAGFSKSGMFDFMLLFHHYAGDGNYIENSNPTLLANLFHKYRDVRFILFHGGYPFGSELASLAKNFRHVYIDLCWLYIISPSYAERNLHEWLETVPANKIMAFGGDYHNAENVYGHLLFAREIVTRVLTEKVRERYFSEEEAIKIASMIFHDNAVRIFGLK